MPQPETPSDPPVLTLQLPGGPVGYTDVGDGPVVVALHGAPGSVRDWRWLGPLLEPRIRLVRVDMPGYGDTPRALCADPRSRPRARFLMDFADALGLDRFCVMGHSMGGATALEAAAEHPDRVTSLALLASVGAKAHRAVRQVKGLPAIVWTLNAPVLGAFLRPVLRRSWVRIGFPSTTPDAEKVLTLTQLATLDFERNDENLERLTTPALVAFSKDDPLMEPSLGEDLGSRLGEGPRLRFTDGGHNIQKTQASEIGTALADWLTSREAGETARLGEFGPESGTEPG